MLAAAPAAWLWNFTVDDALISARYAVHIATGVGYRFNPGGPVTDGVTPLGWAVILAPFARGGALGALLAAKAMGLCAWACAAGLLALAVRAVSRRPERWAALALLPISAPLAVWSVAGMETGIVAALAAAAVSGKQLARPWVCSACAGIAAGWRPELLPWTLVVAAAPAPDEDLAGPAARWRARALRVALAAAPFVLVMAARAVLFGKVAPLAVSAKRPDLELGAMYAFACFLLTGPVALLAPLAWRRLGAWPLWLVAATGAHFVAIALAGGDWMPLSRLAVAALPGVILAAAHVASVVHRGWTLVLIGLAAVGEGVTMVRNGLPSGGVGLDRLALIEELAPVLADARVIATIDAGWVGVAAPRSTIVDLAGVTDPAIAAAPGGHITKAWPPRLLDERAVDTALLLVANGEEVASPWYETRFARAADWRLMMATALDFEPVVVSRGKIRYLVVRRKRAVEARLGPSGVATPTRPCATVLAGDDRTASWGSSPR